MWQSFREESRHCPAPITQKSPPPKQAAEYFGFYDIFGKGAAFVGTLMVGAAAQLSGNSRVGIGLLSILFVLGYVCFVKMEKT